MASQIHFLDAKGKPLLSRDYKGDISAGAIEQFPLLLLDLEADDASYKPFVHHKLVNYVFVAHNNLYVCGLTRQNENVMSVVYFLLKLIEVLTQYVKHLEEESIRDNFVIIYELLDEMMDYGLPQTTDTKILKEYITQDYYKLIRNTPSRIVQPPNAVTNSVSWRKEGIFYKKNEAYLDVVESINMLINANGQVLNSEILGEIRIKLHLSGMPDLRLGLNDKGIFTSDADGATANNKGIEMEDIKFHQCVRLSKFENERIITFIPPDGEFVLMLYRLLSTQFLMKPLISVNCKTKVHKHSRIEILCSVKALIKKKSTANNVEVIIPIPDDADTPKFVPEYGTVKWSPEKSCIIWKLKTFPGGKQYHMRAELGLPAVDSDDLILKKPIKVNFSIPYFTTSGIQVRYLRINEPKLQYQSYPWVRYITQNGDDYTIRTKLFMEHSVYEQIRQYRLVLKTRRFKNLQFKNVPKIAKSVDRGAFDGLLNKKNYYTQKLFKLLHDCIDDEPDATDTLLDAQVITNRHLAEKYLQWALKHKDIRTSLATLVEDHTNYLKEMAQKRQKLEKELVGKSQRQHELDRFDGDFYERLKMIEANSVYKLKKLMIPYFCLHEQYTYPELHEDKAWVLQYILKIVH